MGRLEELEEFWKLEHEEFAIAKDTERFRKASNEDLNRLAWNHLVQFSAGELAKLVPTDLFVALRRGRLLAYSSDGYTKSERYAIAKTLAYVCLKLGVRMRVFKSRKKEREEEGKCPPSLPAMDLTGSWTGRLSSNLVYDASFFADTFLTGTFTGTIIDSSIIDSPTRLRDVVRVDELEEPPQREETAVQRIIRLRQERGQQRSGFAPYVPAHQQNRHR